MDIPEKYQEACELLKINKLEASREILENIIDDNPKHFHSINKVGVILARQNRQNDAKLMFIRALEINPDYAPALCNLGNIYNHNKDYDNALKYYRLAIEKDKNYRMPYYNLAVLYKQQKNYEEYLKHIKQYKKRFKLYIDEENAAKGKTACMKLLPIVLVFIILIFICSTKSGI